MNQKKMKKMCGKMTRLIDADALTDELIKGIEADTDKSIQTSFTKSVCMILCKAIEQQPTIDAVPVSELKDTEKERDYWMNMAHSYETTILRLVESITPKEPTVDAVPVKRGMWTFIRLTDKDYGHKAKECSSCGSTFFDTRQWNYCPNCGAYMKGIGDD